LRRGHHTVCPICTQVAEGVATAAAVVQLAQKYRCSLPVLTATASVLEGSITPSAAVQQIMSLPQLSNSPDRH